MPMIGLGLGLALHKGVGGAPAGFGFLTLNGKVLQLSGKNLMLRNT